MDCRSRHVSQRCSLIGIQERLGRITAQVQSSQQPIIKPLVFIIVTKEGFGMALTRCRFCKYEALLVYNLRPKIWPNLQSIIKPNTPIELLFFNSTCKLLANYPFYTFQEWIWH